MSLPRDRIMRPREVMQMLGLSLPTIWRMRRRGEFPEPLRLSPGAVGWRASTIAKWLRGRHPKGLA